MGDGPALDQRAAFAMAYVALHIDASRFARVDRTATAPILELPPRPQYRPPPRRLETPATKLLVAEAANSALQGYRSVVENSPAKDLGDAVKRLLSDLRARYGNEGAKRFTEQAYIALYSTISPTASGGDEMPDPEAMFWATMRTLLDVTDKIDIGLPFICEHYLGDIFIISDGRGARIAHRGGAEIEFTYNGGSYRDPTL